MFQQAAKKQMQSFLSYERHGIFLVLQFPKGLPQNGTMRVALVLQRAASDLQRKNIPCARHGGGLARGE